jgi:hypothetical protein
MPEEVKYPLGPYRLVTVNNAPERAKKLIGRMVEEVKEKYTIIHAGNVDSTSCPLSSSLCLNVIRYLHPTLRFAVSSHLCQNLPSLQISTMSQKQSQS